MGFPFSAIWQAPPLHVSLATGEVHLWLASVDEAFAKIGLDYLSEEERKKAVTLKNDQVRERFLFSRGLTRHILARYLSVPPLTLEFTTSETGKPCLSHTESTLEFNRSHSGNFFVLAVTRGIAVGVDLEKIRPREQMAAIVERWFEESERGQFRNLSELEQVVFFHQCWTRKEAVLKAWGVGLVQLADYAAYNVKSWKKHFDSLPGYAACVALEKKPMGEPQFYTLSSS